MSGVHTHGGVSSRDGRSVHGMGNPPCPFEVLILDDDRFDRSMITRAFASTGLDVQSNAVATLEHFGEALNQRTYDLILVDYRLGDTDGFSAQDIVVNHARNAQTPVVLVSSEIQDDLARTSRRRGIYECLEKNAITSERMSNLLASVSQALAASARPWLIQILEQHRQVVSEDMRQVIREELNVSDISAEITGRIARALAAKGIIPAADPSFLTELLEEPDDFRFDLQ
ncbi:MAG: response regulator [Pseudomonadota bacterium]